MRSKITSFAHSHSRVIVPFNVSSSSYFITITVPVPPKIRIKIPKLLAKTMQKRFYVHGKNARNSLNQHGEDNHNPKRQAKSRRFVGMRKVRSIFANVFGNNKASRNRKHRNYKGGFFIENVVKRAGFGFAKARGIKLIGHEVENNSSVSERLVVIGRRESVRKSVEASKREVQSHGTFGVVRLLRNVGSKKFDFQCLDINLSVKEEENDSLELCKKRILMGSKCKPLTISGSLHYDKNGILLPEEIP